jgi:ribosome-associated translation inhibitor RaiA
MMKLPLQIVFDDLEASPALEAGARVKLVKLNRQHPHILSCRIVFSMVQKHQRQGRPVSVHIELRLSGHALVVDRVADEDPYVALRDAFDAIKRQLDEAVGRLRGQMKYQAPACAQAGTELVHSTQ